MDPTNCSLGYRTDAFLLYGSEITPQACDVPVVAFAIVAGSLIAARLLVVGIVFTAWCKRQKLGARKGFENRLPLVPGLFLLALFAKFFFLVLGGTNVVSSINGTSGTIFMLWTFVSMTIALMYLNKIVRLGGKLGGILESPHLDSNAYTHTPITVKIIPLSRTTMDTKKNSEEKNMENLDKLDSILYVNLSLSILCAVLVFVFYFILGTLVYPGALWTAQAAWGATSVFIFVIGLSLAYQFERCVRATQRLCMSSSSPANAGEYVSPSGRSQALMVQVAIRKMRFQQIILAVFTLPTSLLFALFAAKIIHFTWIWALILCGMDVVLFLAMTLSNTNICQRSKNRDSKISSSAGRAKNNTGGGNPNATLTLTAQDSSLAQEFTRHSLQR